MSPIRVHRSRARLVVLFAGTLALAACGGGGGGGDAAPAPAPAPGPVSPTTSALSLADCLQSPAGTDATYLNAPRPRHQWRAATFLGQSDGVVARAEFASATAATPQRIAYVRFDPAAGTVTPLGREELNAAGAVTLREQFVGLSASTALAPGQSEAHDYTVRTLVPTGVADRRERATVLYEGNEVVTLPDATPGNVSQLGRVNTCRVRTTLESLAGATPSPLSVETAHHVPRVGVVKSYTRTTLPSSPLVNQTAMAELVASNVALTVAPSLADAAPSLALCSALSAGRDVTLTASSAGEANNARRTVVLSTFGAAQAMAIQRRHIGTDAITQISYMDVNVGQFLFVGEESFGDQGGQLVVRRTRDGRPDLRRTPASTPVTYTERFTTIFPQTLPADASTDTFTFEGFAKVITPAGSFDTCKVRFAYQSGLVETYFHAPNLHWVRLDSTFNGVRTTRELLTHTP